MPVHDDLPSGHNNRYNADSVCGHCDGIICHEPWCITQNASVQYAYQAASAAGRLSQADHLILHALGVVWAGKRIRSRVRPNKMAAEGNVRK
jgi:hypothetical protein